MDNLDEQIKDAMYARNFERLQQLAPCDCCCDEHYRLDCPAHRWFGCRGSYAIDRDYMDIRQALDKQD
jgi:hypothetical protein